MKKYTKIIATIGPASHQPETLRSLQKTGMNIARINLSHGDRTSQSNYISNIRMLNPNFPILLDTKGPEIRTGRTGKEAIIVHSGDQLRLVHSKKVESSASIPVDYSYLHEIPSGTRVLFDDGLVESEIIGNSNGEPVVRILNDGTIGKGKKVTLQGYRVKLPFLTEPDKKDLLFAIENGIYLIAASFVRSGDDVRMLRKFFTRHGSEKVFIISKIEHADAIANLGDIIEQSDGLMVARGDLGVELPLEEVPGIQEKIIKRCNLAGKPVIVATQMLESMRENPRPTRAEVNDTAHAILQGADAIMLSAETATGTYPERSVAMMDLIARQYESKVKGIIKKYRRTEERGQTEIAQFIAKAAYYASDELNISAILTPTESGFTPRNVARFRPRCPILAFTKDSRVEQFLHLIRGVFPSIDADGALGLNHHDMSLQLVRRCYEEGHCSLDNRIVLTSGSNLVLKRGTNLLEVYSVKDLLQDGALPEGCENSVS